MRGAGAAHQRRQSAVAAGKSYRRIVCVYFEIRAGNRYLCSNRATLRIEIGDDRRWKIIHYEIARTRGRAAFGLHRDRAGRGIGAARGLRYLRHDLTAAGLLRACETNDIALRRTAIETGAVDRYHVANARAWRSDRIDDGWQQNATKDLIAGVSDDDRA